MSKKKTLSTMSLKDFHGGSIPSDLPLPSAPDAVIRSGPDRTNFARSDLHPRPKSSGGTHGFDEKASFLTNPSPIGKNFDEDERKPLDGSSLPRRTVNDDTIRSFASMKPAYVSSVRDRPVTSAVTSLGSGRFSGGVVSGSLESREAQFGRDFKGLNANNSVGYGENSIGGRTSDNNNPPNAGRARRDVGGGDGGLASVGVSNATKFVQASAIDEVSSGMWQLKSPSQLLPQLVKGSSGGLGVGERSDFGGESGSPVENDGILDYGNQGRELISQYQSQTPREEGWRGAGSVGSQLRLTTSPEELEPPRGKFLPRSKTWEKSENEYKQATDSGQIRVPSEIHRTANLPNWGSTDARTGGQPIDKVERPKLNLKPRSQPLDQPDRSLEKERNSLFGGARPRELVLKERGVDDVAINNLEVVSPVRAMSSNKKERTSEQLVPPPRNNPKFENPRLENRTSNRRFGNDNEQKDQQADHDKSEVERRNWRNDKWRSNKDAKEQRPEPETWRKPIEEPNPVTTDASGFRHGKLVSAMELAQAFSKSVSEPKATDLHSSQRGFVGRNNQVPFSRLTVPTPVHRING